MLVDLSPDEVAFLFSYNPISIHPNSLSVRSLEATSVACDAETGASLFILRWGFATACCDLMTNICSCSGGVVKVALFFQASLLVCSWEARRNP